MAIGEHMEGGVIDDRVVLLAKMFIILLVGVLLSTLLPLSCQVMQTYKGLNRHLIIVIERIPRCASAVFANIYCTPVQPTSNTNQIYTG